MAELTEETFCRAVERALRERVPGLAVSVAVEAAEFVLVMGLPGRPPNTWRWPVLEPAYDAALGAAWSLEQADYLALLAEEENLEYLAGHPRRVGDGISVVLVRKHRSWRRN